MIDGERDRIIRHDYVNRYFLFNLGAERARGRRLFFIEAHCVAEPSCLERMLEFLDSNGCVGASCRSISWSESEVGGYEEELFGHSLAWLPLPEHWYKVLIHGFAVDREAFEAVGGFPHRFGNYSDLALAATFERGGYKLGYAEEAVVRHFYAGHMRPTFEYVRDHNHGEMAFCAEHPASDFIRYVPESFEWKRRGIDRATARRLRTEAAAALRCGGLPWRLRLSLARSAIRPSGRPLLGGRPRLWRARAEMAARWAAMAARVGLRRPTFDSYLAWWDAMTRFGRLEYLVPDGVSPRPWPAAEGPLELGDADDRALSGFGLVEELDGRRFRWSARAAAVELALAPGSYEIRLDLLPKRHMDRDLELAADFDGNRVPDEAITREREAVTIRIGPEAFPRERRSHSLSLFCTTLPRRRTLRASRLRDRRALGLPVERIEVVEHG
jgi:hypothetical protein